MHAISQIARPRASAKVSLAQDDQNHHDAEQDGGDKPGAASQDPQNAHDAPLLPCDPPEDWPRWKPPLGTEFDFGVVLRELKPPLLPDPEPEPESEPVSGIKLRVVPPESEDCELSTALSFALTAEATAIPVPRPRTPTIDNDTATAVARFSLRMSWLRFAARRGGLGGFGGAEPGPATFCQLPVGIGFCEFGSGR